jgi:hypothetical protein
LVAYIKGSTQENRPRVFENRELRKISGSNSEEVTGEWRKLLEKELLDLCCSPDILWLIASSRMGWVRHVARMEKKIIGT